MDVLCYNEWDDTLLRQKLHCLIRSFPSRSPGVTQNWVRGDRVLAVPDFLRISGTAYRISCKGNSPFWEIGSTIYSTQNSRKSGTRIHIRLISDTLNQLTGHLKVRSQTLRRIPNVLHALISEARSRMIGYNYCVGLLRMLYN